MMGAIVGGQLVSLAPELELRVRDAIANAPDGGSKIGRLLHVLRQAVVPEDDIAQLALSVRRVQLDDDAAVVGDLGDQPVLVGEGVQVDFLPVELAPLDLSDGAGGARRLLLGRLGRGGAGGELSEEQGRKSTCTPSPTS